MPTFNNSLMQKVITALKPYMYKEEVNFRTLEQAIIIYNDMYRNDDVQARRAVIYIGENA